LQEGRLVLLAFMSGASIPNANIGAILFKRLQIIGTTLRARDEEYQGHLLSRFEKEALPLMKKGGVEVRIHEVFDWKDVQKSHEMMEVRFLNSNSCCGVHKGSGSLRVSGIADAVLFSPVLVHNRLTRTPARSSWRFATRVSALFHSPLPLYLPTIL
jgi:hypothetical protein